MLKLIASLFITFILLFSTPVAPAEAAILDYFKPARQATETERETIYGKVVYISDGDTIHLQQNNGIKIKIRLYGIDAPEKSQAYGPQSTGILRQLIGNQYVSVKSFGEDRYHRCLGKIFLNRQDINAEMLRLGAAWHYKYYDKTSDFQRYADIENSARQNHRGLWNKPNPTPPWEYRKRMRAQGQR